MLGSEHLPIELPSRDAVMSFSSNTMPAIAELDNYSSAPSFFSHSVVSSSSCRMVCVYFSS